MRPRFLATLWLAAAFAFASAPFAAARADQPDTTTVASDSTATEAPPGETASDSSATIMERAVPEPEDDLGPSSRVPWNPPATSPAAETWETVLRAPGRLLSLPLVVLGAGTRSTMLAIEQTNVVPTLIYLVKLRPEGLTIAPASLGDRTGLGATFGVSLPPASEYLRAEWSGSTKKYSHAAVGAGWGPIRAAYDYGWRPSERFYGVGLQSSQEDTSVFASQTERVRVIATFPTPRRDRPPARSRLSVWAGPRSLVVRSGREDDTDSFEQAFPSLGPAMLDRRVEHLVYGARVELDRRAGRPHWSRGHRIALQMERFDRPIEGLALHSAGADGAQFTRTRLDVEVGASFHRDPRTLRLAFTALDQRLSEGSRPLLLPDLATLGGSAGLAGFEAGRFHDLDALLLKLTYLFPLLEYLEFELHAETGGVYAGMRHDLRLDGLKSSFGFAFRPRLPTGPLGAFGIDWSSEKVRLRYSLGGVE